jgi:hypothetical protein
VIDDWFSDFLAEHRARHPHALLPEMDSEDGASLYVAWRKVFVLRGIHHPDVATEASQMLTGETLPGPRHHFPRLVELAIGIYKARNPEPSRAKPAGTAPDMGPPPVPPALAAECRDCPECGGTGWANRHAVWQGMGVFKLDLFCRCDAGRWRISNDHELTRGDRTRKHDDLQANPEIWDQSKTHRTFDAYPARHDLVMPPGSDGKWRYLTPGEEVPSADGLKAMRATR